MEQTSDGQAVPEERAAPAEGLGETLLRQAFQLWIEPEIVRRREAGRIVEGFQLVAAQIVFNVEADGPEIRLNHEIRGVLEGRVARPVQKGEVARIEDFTEYADLQLAPQDGNAGHVTILRHGDGYWWIKFDFTYNAGRIADVIAAAEEFLDAAAAALTKRHQRAFIDTLHSAVELLAKGVLLSVPDKRVVLSKGHGFIAARYNLWGKHGYVPALYVQLLNTLAELRPSARYLRRAFSLDSSQAQEMLTTAHEMLSFLMARSPKRPGRPSTSDVVVSDHS